MSQPPHLNDYLDLLRVSFGKAIERARRAFETELAASSRTGFGGNTIKAILDSLQLEFESSVTDALAKLSHVRKTTELDASDLRGLTAQELENFARQLKSTVQLDRLLVKPGTPLMAVVDEELAKLDEYLRFALRQFDVGFFDIGGSRGVSEGSSPNDSSVKRFFGVNQSPNENISRDTPFALQQEAGGFGLDVAPGLDGIPESDEEIEPTSSASIIVAPTVYPENPTGPIVVENHITINLGSFEAQKLFAKLDELVGALDQSNEISGELREQIKSEITAGRTILSAPKANRNLIDLLLVRPLRWLAEKAGAAVVGTLADDALKWLFKLLGQ